MAAEGTEAAGAFGARQRAREDQRAQAAADLEACMKSPGGRRWLTRTGDGQGMAFYARQYLRLATPRCHQRWYRAFGAHRRLLFEAPRSHGKSISAGRVFVGHAILTNRNTRVLLIGKTQKTAAKTARLVRRDLERNPRIRRDWTGPEAGGPFRERGLTWTDSLFYVRRSKDLRDPTVEAAGVGGAITGGRFDLIVLDDPVDDENTHTRARREKLRSWFYGTVLPLLDRGGRIIVIGTRKHAADLYAVLEEDPTFAVVKDRAVVGGLGGVDMSRVQWVEKLDERTGRRQLVDALYDGPEPEVLWPEKWPLRELLLMLRSMGTLLFQREMQNEIVDDGSSPFRIGWLNQARERPEARSRGMLSWGWDDEKDCAHPLCEGMIVWQCWDFSLVDEPEKAAEQDSDWTTGETWGLDWETGERTLLRMVRRRGLTQGEVIALIREEAARFPQRLAVVVENNSFGKLFEMGVRRTTDLPIVAHTVDKKKHDLYEGVPAMSALYEAGKMILPSSPPGELGGGEEDPRAMVDVLVAEHHGLGREAHDDTVMCAWAGETWLRRFIRAEEKRRKLKRPTPNLTRPQRKAGQSVDLAA